MFECDEVDDRDEDQAKKVGWVYSKKSSKIEVLDVLLVDFIFEDEAVSQIKQEAR